MRGRADDGTGARNFCAVIHLGPWRFDLEAGLRRAIGTPFTAVVRGAESQILDPMMIGMQRQIGYRYSWNCGDGR